jgi:hypothetical protein
MLDIARYLAIVAIAGMAIGSEPTTTIHVGTLSNEMLAAMAIALLATPNVLRWGR